MTELENIANSELKKKKGDILLRIVPLIIGIVLIVQGVFVISKYPNFIGGILIFLCWLIGFMLIYLGLMNDY